MVSHLETEFTLNFSSSSFVIRVLKTVSILNHACSFMLYYYLLSVFHLSKLLFSSFLQSKVIYFSFYTAKITENAVTEVP